MIQVAAARAAGRKWVKSPHSKDKSDSQKVQLHNHSQLVSSDIGLPSMFASDGVRLSPCPIMQIMIA